MISNQRSSEKLNFFIIMLRSRLLGNFIFILVSRDSQIYKSLIVFIIYHSS